MANNPSNHIPSFQEWFLEMIDDLDKAAVNLYKRADQEFLPKVALCSSLEGYTAAVDWTKLVNGVINTLLSYGRKDLAQKLALELHRAVAFPEEFIAERAQLMTLEEEMAIILGDMDSE